MNQFNRSLLTNISFAILFFFSGDILLLVLVICVIYFSFYHIWYSQIATSFPKNLSYYLLWCVISHLKFESMIKKMTLLHLTYILNISLLFLVRSYIHFNPRNEKMDIHQKQIFLVILFLREFTLNIFLSSFYDWSTYFPNANSCSIHFLNIWSLFLNWLYNTFF